MLRCYSVRQPAVAARPSTKGYPGNSKASAAPLGSLAANASDSCGVELHLEASFVLPGIGGGSYRELLLLDHGIAHTSAAWAFLPQLRVVARGGFSDGSVYVGCC